LLVPSVTARAAAAAMSVTTATSAASVLRVMLGFLPRRLCLQDADRSSYLPTGPAGDCAVEPLAAATVRLLAGGIVTEHLERRPPPLWLPFLVIGSSRRRDADPDPPTRGRANIAARPRTSLSRDRAAR
jgi:hypothetical protein